MPNTGEPIPNAPDGYSTGQFSLPMAEENGGADVGIVTVLPVESRAVISQFNVTSNKPLRNRIFRHGSVRGGDDAEISVVTTQCLDPQAESMSSAISVLVDLYRPSVLMIVGIGGAVDNSVALGDVVIANQILSYGPRKETKDGPKHRGGGFLLDAKLKPIVNELEIDWPELMVNTPESDRFRIHVGPIGAGPSVIADENSENISWLRSVNSKVLAVETEATGLAQYFYEHHGSNPGLRGYVVIRGISDYADSSKNDDFHAVASGNAATVAASICKYL